MEALGPCPDVPMFRDDGTLWGLVGDPALLDLHKQELARFTRAALCWLSLYTFLVTKGNIPPIPTTQTYRAMTAHHQLRRFKKMKHPKIKILGRILLAASISKTNPRQALSLLECGILFRYGFSGLNRSIHECESPLCLHCCLDAGHRRADLFVDELMALHQSGFEILSFMGTQVDLTGESAPKARQRLLNSLSGLICDLRGTPWYRRKLRQLLRPCVEDDIGEIGRHHFHFHVVTAWKNPDKPWLRDQWKGNSEGCEIALCRTLLDPTKIDHLVQPRDKVVDHLKYHLKGGIHLKHIGPAAIFAAAEAARLLKGKHWRRRPVRLDPGPDLSVIRSDHVTALDLPEDTGPGQIDLDVEPGLGLGMDRRSR